MFAAEVSDTTCELIDKSGARADDDAEEVLIEETIRGEYKAAFFLKEFLAELHII